MKRPGPLFWVLAVASPLLLVFTSHKLYDMCRLRGWIGAVRVTHEQVRSKARTAGDHEPDCWVAWTDRDPTRPGNHRTNVECDRWATLEVGAPIDVLYLPDESGANDEPYLRDGGVYTSNGNFGFDLGLLALELFGCVYFATRAIRWRLALKRERAPVWPSG